ncbi:phage integrase family protein [Duganella vulcania]|uniref:Core-binding (CB) domain-containing protein n=1 Tax=Duganella vulcania TaxID=2692166 RepID=A0A845GFN5_9BURK|nr:phage integrase family protein [Duganella vulcania]MYM92761.1 hypothetical protein [Duganella vulcania]
MAQNVDILLGKLTYTRADYTALRAYVQRVPVQTIASLYYSEDSPQVEQGLERFLLDMRTDLIERCIENNPAAAQALQHARAGGQITLAALEILIRVADVPQAVPKRSDPIAQWVRPKTANALKLEGVQTVDGLMALIGRRGALWWRGVPRIGAKRAAVLQAWLQGNEHSLGKLNVVTLLSDDELVRVDLEFHTTAALPPLARLRLPPELDGSVGVNRARRHSDIFAHDDLAAVTAYLARFVDRPETLRAYTREVERFVFWCVLERGKPLSSVSAADCAQYRLFLQAPSERFIGPKTKRTSPYWRPFATRWLSPESQHFAVRAVMAMFKYLVSRSYLAGDPWIGSLPRAPHAIAATGLQLPAADLGRISPEIWDRVLCRLRVLAADDVEHQLRTALAGILLIGEVGLTRSELVSAERGDVASYALDARRKALRVPGTKGRPRDIVLGADVLEALNAHWSDRGLDFWSGGAAGPLLAPLIVPPVGSSQRRHGLLSVAGYTADGIYKVVRKALRRVAKDLVVTCPNDADELDRVSSAGPRVIRALFESRLRSAGAQPFDIEQILGRKTS